MSLSLTLAILSSKKETKKASGPESLAVRHFLCIDVLLFYTYGGNTEVSFVVVILNLNLKYVFM